MDIKYYFIKQEGAKVNCQKKAATLQFKLIYSSTLGCGPPPPPPPPPESGSQSHILLQSMLPLHVTAPPELHEQFC